MTRFAAGVEYDGAWFAGWQSQKGVPTVQDAVELALSRVLDEPIRVIAAGRTDTGVHALGQVIHFETNRLRPIRAFTRGANSHLGPTVTMLWAKPVPNDFHARFSALSRTYRYVILNRHTRPAVFARRVAFEYRSLDVSRMQEAAKALVGEHDFSSYRAVACQAASPIRTIHTFDIQRQGAFVILTITANGFLHHMVRNMVGVLVTIGAGEQPPIWAADILARRDRRLGGVTATPDGLYFLSVAYPPQYCIAQIDSSDWAFTDL